MQFTKSLIAAAMLVATGVAQAAAPSTYVDEVLTVVDTTTGAAYAVDLGVTPASLLSSPSLTYTVNASADANLTSFLAAEGTSDNIIWRVEGGTYTKPGALYYDNVISTFTTANAADFSTIYPNNTSGTAAFTSTYNNVYGELNGYVLGGVANASYYQVSGFVYAPGEGILVNSAAPGTSLNLWSEARTGTNAYAPTELAAADFNVTGTGSAAVATLTVSSVPLPTPLPTSVWLFLSGVMGVLSLKRRKAA
jgi:hypothetical protein